VIRVRLVLPWFWLMWAAAAPAAGASELARADALWAQRAEGQREGRAQPERSDAAVAGFERALERDPDDLEAHWKLLRAQWFAADFGTRDAASARARYEQALAGAEPAFALLASRAGGGVDARACEDPEALRARIPSAARRDAAELYFWYAINLGAWSRSAGLLQAVRRGVANRLHAATLCSLALDPDVEQGGAIRLLSRLHSELPRVPLVSGWVDARRAVPLAERALAEYPAHPGNRYLLGLALLSHAPDRRAEALRLIEATAELEPRADHVVEDLAIRRDAHERLAREPRG
jgi:tetratricopeptide (TPR) repeat protein